MSFASLEGRNVMIGEKPLNSKPAREKLAEILFESLGSSNVYIQLETALVLYGSGRTTGLVVDIGAGITSMVPIYEGYGLGQAVN